MYHTAYTDYGHHNPHDYNQGAIVHYDPNLADRHHHHQQTMSAQHWNSHGVAHAHNHGHSNYLPAISQDSAHSHHRHHSHSGHSHGHHRHRSHSHGHHRHSHNHHHHHDHDDDDEGTRPNSKERVSIEINVNDHRKNKNIPTESASPRKFSVTPRQSKYDNDFDKNYEKKTAALQASKPTRYAVSNTRSEAPARYIVQNTRSESPKETDLYRKWKVGTVIRHSPKPIVDESVEPRKPMRAKHKSKHICSLCPHNEYELEHGVPFHSEETILLKEETKVLNTKKAPQMKSKAEILTTKRKMNRTPAASETKQIGQPYADKKPQEVKKVESMQLAAKNQQEPQQQQMALVPIGYQFTQPEPVGQVVYETVQPIDQQETIYFIPAEDFQNISFVPATQELPRIVELPREDSRTETPVNTISVFHPPVEPKIREYTYVPSKSPSLILNSPTSNRGSIGGSVLKEKSDVKKRGPVVHHYVDEVKQSN